MKKLKRIFLLRHGQSEANVENSLNIRTPDHRIQLTDTGEKQGFDAGVAFDNFIEQLSLKYPEVRNENFRLWVSPYDRTRKTADKFLEGTGGMGKIITSRKESTLLVEQQFGLFDGLSDAECLENYPEETAHYNKSADNHGKFWAKIPQGESRFDVTIRAGNFIPTIFRDADRGENSIENVVIVTHGVTARAIRMNFMNYEYEWFEKQPNPDNCSIQYIAFENNYYKDKDFIYTGGKSTLPYNFANNM